MTKEEIIEMAKKVGVGMLHDGEFALMGNEKIKAFAKLIAEKEREACAKICEDLSNTEANMNKTWRNGCKSSADAIRARGQE